MFCFFDLFCQKNKTFFLSYYLNSPALLPFRDSLVIVWPQVTGLIAATIACFALSYYLFIRLEIRS